MPDAVEHINILTLAPLLAPVFLDIEFNAALTAANQQLINGHTAILGGYGKYINRLHDSEILQVTNDGGCFTITLNDMGTVIYADALISTKNIKIDQTSLQFPVTIKFIAAHVSYHTVDDNGALHDSPVVELNEYLYEQIVSIDENTIKVGIVAWQTGRNKPGQRILLLINANAVELTEQQQQAWTKYFGPAKSEHYEHYRSLFATGEYLADQTHCEGLIAAYDASKK